MYIVEFDFLFAYYLQYTYFIQLVLHLPLCDVQRAVKV